MVRYLYEGIILQCLGQTGALFVLLGNGKMVQCYANAGVKTECHNGV